MTAPIAPVAGLTLPRTRADWQTAYHAILLALVPVLALTHIGTTDQINGWLLLVFAAGDAVLSFTNTQDSLRAIVYSFGGLIQTVLYSVGALSQTEALVNVGAVMTAINAIIAIFYTPTSTLKVVASPHKEAA